jgi:hypothetical protein
VQKAEHNMFARSHLLYFVVIAIITERAADRCRPCGIGIHDLPLSLICTIYCEEAKNKNTLWQNNKYKQTSVGEAVIAPGLRAYPSRSCDGWVCGLGAVGASLVFGLATSSVQRLLRDVRQWLTAP